MAETKTKPTKVGVDEFLAGVANDSVREDCKTLIKIMKRVTKAKPVMWGPSIVGFGSYHYKYESGHEGDTCLAGFAPRGRETVIYILTGFPGQAALLKKLGPHRTGKVCLYIKRLADVDVTVLEEMVRRSIDAATTHDDKRAR